MPKLITQSVGAWEKGAVNVSEDVKIVQELLEAAARAAKRPEFDPKGVDGKIAKPPRISDTVKAILAFQSTFLRQPDGLVEPNHTTLRKLNEIGAKEVGGLAPWIKIARQEIGVKEKKGLGENNSRILEYIATFPYLEDIFYKKSDKMMSEVDETAWCACFVNWCLIKAGQPKGPSARAKDWLKYGTKLIAPRAGAIAVVYHTPGKSTAGTTSSGYHVAFYTGGVGNSITLLGGNQGDQVSEKKYTGYWTVQGYVWPGGK